MEPVFQLSQLLNRYLRNEIDLRTMQEGLVPLLPYFGERQAKEPFARMAVEVDSVIVELMTGEAVEDDLKAVIAAMPNPTLVLSIASELPRGSTSSTVHEVLVRPVTGTIRWAISVGAGPATAVRRQREAAPA
jgi:hypothetical protein